MDVIPRSPPVSIRGGRLIVTMTRFTMSRRGALLLGLAFLGFAYLFVVTGWVVDDAYITFRTVDNFLSGHGLTWNAAERVQAYTHPLWMLILALVAFFTREYFFTSLVVSFLLSAVTLGVGFVHFGREGTSRTLVFVALLLTSKAVVDYSSSGLENPLTYALLILFYARYLGGNAVLRRSDKTEPTPLFLIAALSFLNRADTILLFIPALGEIAWSEWKERRCNLWKPVAMGSIPVVAWLLFAAFYYGFPLPNTAYAKMMTGSLSLAQRLERGSLYYTLVLRWDWLAFLAILVAVLVTVRRRLWRPLMGLCGVALYLVYVWPVASAATHMAGRFFAAPIVAGTFIAAHTVSSRNAATFILALAVVYAIVNPVSPWKVGTRWYHTITRSTSGYIDTRWFAHREGTSLLRRIREGRRWTNPCLADGVRFRASAEIVHVGGCEGGDPIGFFGYAAGPDKWVIDRLGLSDPLLARLQPCIAPGSGDWRPGHFRRELPDGYVESVRLNENKIEDPGVREFYGVLREATSGPLWSMARTELIVALNLGVYDRLLDPYNQRVAARARENRCRF